MGLGLAAQRLYSPDFAIGVKGGATVSEMEWSPTVRQKFTPGYTGGICMRYTEEKYFGLLAEINFTQRGWAENYPAETGLSYKRTLNYIQVPIMTHIYFGSHKWRGFVNLGPEIGYMLSDHISANFDYKNPVLVPANYRTDQLDMRIANRLDYGIAGGIGAELRLKRKHSILLEGRFYYGLRNVMPTGRREVFGASRSMSIECTLGYMIRLK